MRYPSLLPPIKPELPFEKSHLIFEKVAQTVSKLKKGQIIYHKALVQQTGLRTFSIHFVLPKEARARTAKP